MRVRWVSGLALLAMFACGGEAPEGPAPAPVPAPKSVPEPKPEAAPASASEAVSVQPVSIRFDAETKSIAIEARLLGKALATRKDPVFVGVTVITDDDQEVDLLVHTLFPGNLEESLLFSTEVAHTPKHVLIGAWNTKVEPCKVDRPGCKEFGFVLDNSLASFPMGLYTEGMRQRFVPDGIEIAVQGDTDGVVKAAGDFAAVFGAKVKVTKAELPQPKGVYARQKDDLGMAASIAKELGGLHYGVVSDLKTPLAVVLD